MIKIPLSGYIFSHFDSIILCSFQKQCRVETAEVKYYEYQHSAMSSSPPGETRRVYLGTFLEQIEFDDMDYKYEKLDVPPILESRRSTIVHDFEKVRLKCMVMFDLGQRLIIQRIEL